MAACLPRGGAAARGSASQEQGSATHHVSRSNDVEPADFGIGGLCGRGRFRGAFEVRLAVGQGSQHRGHGDYGGHGWLNPALLLTIGTLVWGGCTAWVEDTP